MDSSAHRSAAGSDEPAVDQRHLAARRLAVDRAAVDAYLRSLLVEHELPHVEVRWGRARTQLGSTRFHRDGRCVITLSELLLGIRGREVMEDTARHEVAHALAGPGEAHGARWQHFAELVGAVPEARSPGPTAPPRWLGCCEAGCEIPRHRLARKLRVGAVCADHQLPIRWLRCR